MNTVRNYLEVVFLLITWQCGNLIAIDNPNVNNLTDSVNKEIYTLFRSNNTIGSPTSVTNTSNVNDGHIPAPSTLKNESEVISEKNFVRTPVMEGGGVMTPQETIPPTKQRSGSEDSGVSPVTPGMEGVAMSTSEGPSTPLLSFKGPENNSLIYDSFPLIDHGNGNSSIVPRKGVPQKIHARKGAVPDNETQDETSSKDIDDLSENNKCALCCSVNNSVVQVKNESDQNCIKCCDMIKNENILQTNKLQVNLLPEEPVTHQKQNSSDSTQNTTTVISTTHKKNKKPQATFDVFNSPTNMSVQQQIQDSNDISSKTDYVVPAVGIILAIPLVIVLIVILYKKGSEFWERRHYRRMDFLIDGMYND